MSTLAASDNGLLGDLSQKNWITANGERDGNLLSFREALAKVSRRSHDKRIKGDEIPLQGLR